MLASDAPVDASNADNVYALVINDRIVDPSDGRVIRRLTGANDYDQAERVGEHRFVVGALTIDIAKNSMRQEFPIAALVGDDQDKSWKVDALVRYESTGAARWRIPIKGARSVRPPDVATGSGRVVVTVDDKIFAFDDDTGAPIWNASGPADRLVSDGATLFTTDCSVHKTPRFVVGRRLLDGKELFRAPIPAEMDPTLTLDARHVIVTDPSRKLTVVLAHDGRELYRLSETMFDMHLVADGEIAVTDARIALLDAAGRERWKIAGPRNHFVAGDEFTEIGGDVILANYGRIDDSGVDVTRIRVRDGVVVWHTEVRGLGVDHSEYQHTAYVDVQGANLYVVSQGSGGSFFERLDTATGKSEARVTMKSER